MEKLKISLNATNSHYSKSFYYIDILPVDHGFENMDCLVFKNYYTTVITVKIFLNDEESVNLLENFKLMEDPDFDDEGEKHHVIFRSQVIRC